MGLSPGIWQSLNFGKLISVLWALGSPCFKIRVQTRYTLMSLTAQNAMRLMLTIAASNEI